MSVIVGYGMILSNGLSSGAEMRAPKIGEVGILNHPGFGASWQQVFCDPTTCKLGGCKVGGPYHQIDKV